jgi:hypothetical protein
MLAKDVPDEQQLLPDPQNAFLAKALSGKLYGN